MNKYTVEQLHDNYDLIPTCNGVYYIEIPDKFIVEILDTTTAPQVYKNKTTLKDKTELINKFKNGNKKLIYIGKAECSNGLRKRISDLIKWGYNESVKFREDHYGGRVIWQIKDNKCLLIYWSEDENAQEKEHRELIDYKEKYGVYPLGNWKS